MQQKLQAPDCRWDVIVCDEAHKVSATVFGGGTKYIKRYRLGQLLSTLTRHFLLMTATPLNGKEEDFQLFMALLDGDRFEGRHNPRSMRNVVIKLHVYAGLLTFTQLIVYGIASTHMWFTRRPERRIGLVLLGVNLIVAVVLLVVIRIAGAEEASRRRSSARRSRRFSSRLRAGAAR